MQTWLQEHAVSVLSVAVSLSVACSAQTNEPGFLTETTKATSPPPDSEGVVHHVYLNELLPELDAEQRHTIEALRTRLEEEHANGAESIELASDDPMYQALIAIPAIQRIVWNLGCVAAVGTVSVVAALATNALGGAIVLGLGLGLCEGRQDA